MRPALASTVSSLLLRCNAPLTVFPPTITRPLIVGFTGTATLGDVVDDVRFFARPWPPDNDETEVLVHGGFADRTTRLCTPELLNTLCAHPDAVIAGHSMGGACAVLLALWAASQAEGGQCPVQRPRHTVHTFGAPRLASAAFCDAYRASGLWERTWRHRTPGDPVVRIPPWLRHVGVEVMVPSHRCNVFAQHSLESYDEHAGGA